MNIQTAPETEKPRPVCCIRLVRWLARIWRQNTSCRCGCHWDVTRYEPWKGVASGGHCNDCGERWKAIEWPRPPNAGSRPRLVKPLDELLKEVSALFSKPQTGKCYTYDFHLGRFPDGWEFRVVNDWHIWVAAGRKTEFGRYETPEAALMAFLDYRRENQINVSALMA